MTTQDRRSHFEAELTLLPTVQGGRARPVRTRYMPNWRLPSSDGQLLASARVELVDREELAPGASGTVRIYPFAPEVWRDVRVGAELDMTEGPSRTMGTAVVTRVVPAAVPVH